MAMDLLCNHITIPGPHSLTSLPFSPSPSSSSSSSSSSTRETSPASQKSSSANAAKTSTLTPAHNSSSNSSPSAPPRGGIGVHLKAPTAPEAKKKQESMQCAAVGRGRDINSFTADRSSTKNVKSTSGFGGGSASLGGVPTSGASGSSRLLVPANWSQEAASRQGQMYGYDTFGSSGTSDHYQINSNSYNRNQPNSSSDFYPAGTQHGSSGTTFDITTPRGGHVSSPSSSNQNLHNNEGQDSSPGSGNDTIMPGNEFDDGLDPEAFSGYCYDRGNGNYTRLIPADMLPPLRDIPAQVQGHGGMVVLPVPRASPPEGGRSSNTESVALLTPSSKPSGDIQSRIDTIVAQTPQTSRRPKVYCDKWVHEGVCAFTQQGCKYKHEMPLDKATQHQLGLFHGFPSWWKKHQAELARPSALPPNNMPSTSSSPPGMGSSIVGGGVPMSKLKALTLEAARMESPCGNENGSRRDLPYVGEYQRGRRQAPSPGQNQRLGENNYGGSSGHWRQGTTLSGESPGRPGPGPSFCDGNPPRGGLANSRFSPTNGGGRRFGGFEGHSPRQVGSPFGPIAPPINQQHQPSSSQNYLLSYAPSAFQTGYRGNRDDNQQPAYGGGGAHHDNMYAMLPSDESGEDERPGKKCTSNTATN
ncbi:hypothetical protein MKZ38_001806 [Zalerion maritima]|uniref:C3H1-type domain-containing protein n=1 Tax=Zalerion maritima TaxID=339359 RepID=A0AAD5RPT0_9PEZI|nr:hypothetical protein MKZ38_001806 [Zalerion maritima]